MDNVVISFHKDSDESIIKPILSKLKDHVSPGCVKGEIPNCASFRIPLFKFKKLLYGEYDYTQRNTGRRNILTQTKPVTEDFSAQFSEVDLDIAMRVSMMEDIVKRNQNIQKSIGVMKDLPNQGTEDIYDILQRGEGMVDAQKADFIPATPENSFSSPDEIPATAGKGNPENYIDSSDTDSDFSEEPEHFPAIFRFIRENRSLRSITRGKFGRIYSKKYMTPIMHIK